MGAALDDASIDPSEIGYVNAHGTSTPLNDAAEAPAIRKLFSAPPPVTSVKGVVGHMIGAAGVLSIRDGVAPPTANVDQVGDDIWLDIVTGSARAVGPRPVISNSFGFGGHNASLVLAPADD